MEQQSRRPKKRMALVLAAGLLAAGILGVFPVEKQPTQAGTQTLGRAILQLTRRGGGQDKQERKQVSRTVIPLGRTVGIKLFSDGVLVVGLADIPTQSGTQAPGRELGLKAGDVITHINDREVDTIEEVQSLVQDLQGEHMTLKVSRGDKQLQLSGAAVCSAQGHYQLGVWIRDSMAGIGTMTFYDPQSNIFAALGHGINDVDTAQLMPLQSGSIMYSTVSDVKKGLSGAPGELHGTFDVDRDLGQLYANTQSGIFGTLTDKKVFGDAGAMEVALPGEVKTGTASILSNIAGETVKEYRAEIVHVYSAVEGETRNMMIRITDPELLEQTGGIVQGMSGSPILQNGRIVGAVTHVLVNDPTRGYGIFIENMLEAAGGSNG